MIPDRQSYANRHEVLPTGFFPKQRAKSVLDGAIRTLNLTVADALHAYAVTDSAFAALLVLAAPHLELFVRCIVHGKG
jgi:hypothetical protein